MATQDNAIELKMDPASLYREEIFTDRQAGTLRRLTPVKTDGSTDDKRKTLYMGQAQLLTPLGTIPLAFDIEAHSLGEAVEKFAAAARVAVADAVQELQELRREAASSIVVPDRGAGGWGGPGGLPGGGKIQLP
jgi:hypothetical protein